MLRGPECEPIPVKPRTVLMLVTIDFILIIGAIRLYASLSRTGSFTTFRETSVFI